MSGLRDGQWIIDGGTVKEWSQSGHRWVVVGSVRPPAGPEPSGRRSRWWISLPVIAVAAWVAVAVIACAIIGADRIIGEVVR